MGTQTARPVTAHHLIPGTISTFIMAILVCAPVWLAAHPLASQALDWQIVSRGKMSFDTATVQKSTASSDRGEFSVFPLGPGDVFVPNGGRFMARNFPVVAYIEFAFKLTEDQEISLLPQLPKWVTTERYDIEAASSGNPTKDQMRLMMQSLLAERFRLTAHFEKRDIPVYALLLDVPGKLGPLLQQHPEDSPCATTPWVPTPPVTAPPQSLDTRFPGPCGGIVNMRPSVRGRVRAGARNVTMELIASSMTGPSKEANRPVVDRTGLTGKFDFAIEFLSRPDNRSAGPSSSPNVSSPNASSPNDANGPSYLQALKDQLGLKLEPQMGNLEVFVIDYIEQPQN
jgi:bla regulator protein blaR1